MAESDFAKSMKKRLRESSPEVRQSFARKAFEKNTGGTRKKTTSDLGRLGLSRKEIKRGRSHW